ncbi:FMN-binding glutamate synthase family protein [Psychroflexus sediminis]|uniref:Glutamate synthase domain-containing protein 2 n=1 Tax=Psychroflexus sediminis TaxID=470826 RepID=A0A1G7Z6K9_9FLAO|nr:FMN-binding glutamate synthase family protein [Psychroflexus sediminis]SDH04392.1 Glutamate synthase domain-containing protein 2 [Psychroflexus sediminis]
MKEAIRFTAVFVLIFVLLICAFIWPVPGLVILAVLLLTIGLYDLFQKKYTVLRNYPVLGHMRYLLEMIGPELRQYFVESGTDAKPIDRNHRTYVYERAKEQTQTHPFGTELDLTNDEYRWMQHSMYPAKRLDAPPRVKIGGKDCKQPYEVSIFNISAMSFGSLSNHAIEALNLAAKDGGFYHNTGEGGISDYHLKGGDLVWQIGTAYFGCRGDDGSFNSEDYKKNANREEVKMIELKISQGAKPGHGGVLPALKNDKEIAEIRGLEPYTTIVSPPGHQEFDDAEGLLNFIKKLRDLSNGKPVGFKLSLGSKEEFFEICETMKETGIKPDFITVDGAEGGTGAAPIDFSNYVGMPWEDALIFVVDTLREYDLKEEVKVITATKLFTAFDIFKALCIGADVCNSARGMMLSLGCIQAMKCNTNECPTGVTTNDPRLVRGLVVSEKWKRVRNYQKNIIEDFLDLLSASGCSSIDQLKRAFIYKKIEHDWSAYDKISEKIKV